MLTTRHYPGLDSASDWSCRVGNLLQPIKIGIRMPGVSQRASRIFIRRARTATEARHTNYFSLCTI